MSVRIDAGANRPAGPQRLNLANLKQVPTTTSSASAPATFRLQDPQGSRLRELMQQANEAATAEQRAELQGELDRLRSSLGTDANAPEVLATLAELSVASENVTAARSQLSDVGAARAAAKLAREQIRQFAPAAIQAQANAAPSSTQGLLGS
jgi:flagellin